MEILVILVIQNEHYTAKKENNLNADHQEPSQIPRPSSQGYFTAHEPFLLTAQQFSLILYNSN